MYTRYEELFVNIPAVFVRLYLTLLLTMGYALVVFLSVGFLPIMLGFIFAHLTPFSFLEVWVGAWFAPLLFILFVNWYAAEIRAEANMVRAYGPTRALWVTRKDSITGTIFQDVVLGGLDLVTTSWKTLIPELTYGRWGSYIDALPEFKTEEGASRLWSYCILTAEKASQLWGLGLLVLFWKASGLWVLSLRWMTKSQFSLLRLYILILGLVWSLNHHLLARLIGIVEETIKLFSMSEFRLWLRWRLTHLALKVTILALDAENLARKYTPVKNRQPGFADVSRPGFVSLVREKLMQATIFVSDIALPHYIRGSRPVTKAGLNESLALMKDLGWPINVKITDEVDPIAESLGFKEWLLCGTDWKQGITNLKLYIDDDLEELRKEAPVYVRSEEYANTGNELLSLSRYFKSPKYSFPDLDLDDVWYVMKTTFANSRLTPFNYIIRMWEKKYGLGAFMRRSPNSKSKMSRRAFIKQIGGLGPLKELWRRTFEFSTVILPVSAVSVKGEALGPSKWMKDKVRTVVGSPIGHYILSTIWNYEPNHRFNWQDTPSKPGMPINGYWLADLYHRHSRCQHHFAGDMTEFDSTVVDKVQDMVKAVRKKGFENHKDFDRICNLIDVGYDQIQHQLLNTTSTGNVYLKGSGLSTGHSATTADNSLVIFILYMLAWKELTGLGAKEFKHFNELSDYGDDHVLSYLSTKPASWNFKNIQKCMAKWGVTNNLEAEGDLSKIPFLSKFSRKVTHLDKLNFEKFQVPVPKRIVYHDRDKLIGKMTAKVKNNDPRYRAKRLLSYMSLCAHHEDVYNSLHKILTRSSTMKRALKQMGVTVPTYQKVLADWYKPDGKIVTDKYGETADEAESNGMVFHYGKVSWADSLLGFISIIPDLVNPAIFNFGYDRALQLQMRPYLEWAVHFLTLANGFSTQGAVNSGMRKSPYSSLIPDIHPAIDSGNTAESYLLRHWAFMAFRLWTGWQPVRPWLAGLNLKISQAQFILNGQINTEYAVFDWKILDLAIIALCNLIPLSPWLGPIMKIQLPRLDLIWNMVTSWALGLFWSNIPPNYQDVTHVLKRMNQLNGPLLVAAPTGTGKSTSFIKHVSLSVGHFYDKIIVVEPRSILVQSLVPYVKDTLNLDATGRTMGMDFDKTRKVWYVTAQEALLHLPETVNSHNLVIMDECHVDEASYLLLQQILNQLEDVHSIWLTATPTQLNESLAAMVIPLEIAKLWQTQVRHKIASAAHVEAYLREYTAFCLDVIENSWNLSRILVFHPSIEGGHRLGELISRPVSYLNSGSTDSSGRVLISTSVADAGITLPDVDIVISPNLDYVGSGVGMKPVLCKISNETMTQRAGRTGRTNNGIFFSLSYQGTDVPNAMDVRLDDKSMVGDWLTTGVPLPVILTHSKPTLEKAFHVDLLPQDKREKMFNEQMSHLLTSLNNLEYWKQSRTLQQADAIHSETGQVIFDYTAAGNVSESSLFPVGRVIQDVSALAIGVVNFKNNLNFDVSVVSSALNRLMHLTALKVPFHLLVDKELLDLMEVEYDIQEYNALKPNVDKI
nr:RNA-dependent RNA polymerase [Phomopsis vexans fusarivirus 1]